MIIMNKVGIFYAFWEHNWDADFVPYINKVAGLGFDVLEINARTVADMSRAERVRMGGIASDAGIELMLCVGLTPVMDPASPDGRTRKRGVEFLQKVARAMNELKAKQLSGIIYGAWPVTLTGREDKGSHFDRSVESMKEAIKAAEDQGVFFNVEVVNRFEQYMLNTAAEAQAYIRRVNSPNLKMLLDTFHMNIEEDSIGGAIRQAGSLLGHFHIGENNRKPPGKGHMPWDEIFIALRDANYFGHIVMEPFLLPGGEIGRDIHVFRDLTLGVDLDEQAKEALAFVRGKLEASGVRYDGTKKI
jgi:D-psicose/D-tagatose/L-ribulose 3-epimerase